MTDFLDATHHLGALAIWLMLSLMVAVAVRIAIRPIVDSAETGPAAVPFLGGAAPLMHAWQRYHFRAIPMVLLFIAFEMEMMFMYPWAVVFVEEGAKALVEMGMFLSILSVGIVYAHREGAFRWQ